MTNDDLPIALRRARRSHGRASDETGKDHKNIHVSRHIAKSSTATPRASRGKRVRFSDPGPASTSIPTPPASSPSSSSTGLTPMVRRTSLARSVTPGVRRRHSTQITTSSTTTTQAGHGASASPRLDFVNGEVHFLPLRQVLEGRVQRRIRRNGLSEEMNSIAQEKRKHAREAKDQLDNLRAELRKKDAEIYELRNATVVLDTDRIWELEQQVERLRGELRDAKDDDNDTVAHSRTYNWTLAARDPFEDADMTDMVEDEEAFGDVTMAQLACSTPSRARHSFPTPPLTSPVTNPATPTTMRWMPTLPTPQAHAGVQVSFADTRNQELEEELGSLQLELVKLKDSLASYTSMATRLSEELSSVSHAAGATNETQPAGETNHHEYLESKVKLLLQRATDQSAALLGLSQSIEKLGFPGPDPSDMIASLRSGFRTARLELEYLTPGEITLPLSSHGAEVLDLLLSRLRDLAKKVREDEASIDEYHELELSLRRQLTTRVEAMDDLQAELNRAQSLLTEKGDRLKELEVSVERLKGATGGYMRDISELESLVGRMEEEQRDALASKDAKIETDRRELANRDERLTSLEAKLSEAVEETSSLRGKIQEVQDAKTKEVAALNKQTGTALALRDGRIMELRSEIDRVNGALRSAHDTIKDLRVQKSGLEGSLVEEKARAKAVIDSMREELQKVLTTGRDMLATPKKDGASTQQSGKASPGGLVTSSPVADGVIVRKGSLFGGDLARRTSQGRKRRRYDSGLGFLEEDLTDV